MKTIEKTMENRIRIGFYYIWDKSWMGGLTYARNLLRALNTLDDRDKPFIDVYCRNNEGFEDLKTHTCYPYLGKVIINDNSIIRRLYRKFLQIVFGCEVSYGIDMFKIAPSIKMFYPYGYGSEVRKLVYWRPDFQEKYLPELFSKSRIIIRDQSIRAIAKRGIPIVFSSYDCENDYRKFYPEYSNKTFVVHFAVVHNDFSYLDIDDVKRKYQIKGDYLLCSNQFWKHKNHLLLFRAYKKALNLGFDKKLVCTGALSDYRNPDYIKQLRIFIEENKLDKYILLPGMIGSDELHCLMKNSYAVVQPSLFEGWNTTVEDCKALSKFIFLSDLRVHKEQAKTNVCFFNPYNEDDLAQKLLSVKPVEEVCDYSHSIRQFGIDFHNVIKYMSSIVD